MPHIIILDELAALFAQMRDYSEQIAAGSYTGKKLQEAGELQDETGDLCAAINTQFRAQIDAMVAAQEAFLGI
jgi:hypothetical protein